MLQQGSNGQTTATANANAPAGIEMSELGKNANTESASKGLMNISPAAL